MIDAINSTSLAGCLSVSGSCGGSSDGTGSSFSAALAAAQRAQVRQKEHDDLIEAVRSKGFTAWARDTQIEKLKEELRKRVMSEMGLTDEDLSKMSSVIQQILAQKIQAEVDKRLQEEMAKQENGSQTSEAATQSTSTTSTTTQQTGKKDQDGKSCPVISAVSWPGSASLF